MDREKKVCISILLMNFRYQKSTINQQREEEKQKHNGGSSWKKLFSERQVGKYIYCRISGCIKTFLSSVE